MCNINFITLPYVFAAIKPVNHGILAILEEHSHLLDNCVPMWTNISLTATETPLTETYMTMWNTCHGNKTDIHNE